ncbi:MAG: hypothetical protein ACYTG5_19345 [Planctomycetota bacterium]|jgi:hypothetical protein
MPVFGISESLFEILVNLMVAAAIAISVSLFTPVPAWIKLRAIGLWLIAFALGMLG